MTPDEKKEFPTSAPDNGNGGKTPTWRWIAEVVLAILMIVIGFYLSETRSDVKILAATKLDKDAYYRDISDIKEMITEMRRDIKDLAQRGR
ncbi:MAG TPA: hypothetical protein ACFYD4_08115 [Candidatus Wunengus sp. YC61]|uniref:hypothetical protein n=1 Tax=Candidatus Wunengus sp. YC61 TaxID=3367698 RepID=UPI00402533B5